MRGLLVLVLLSQACGSASPAAKAPAAPGFDADAVPALGYLYRDTAAVVVLRSPRELDGQVGWDQAAAALGVDLSLGQLERAGVDVDAPIGVAAIDLGAGTTAVFAQVVDGERTLRWIEEEARKRGLSLSRSLSAGADILLPTGTQGLAIVRRDHTVIAIATNGPPSVRDLAAVRVASLARADSLADAEGFRRVMPAVPAAMTVTAYVDFEQLGTGLAAPTATEMQVRDMIEEYERRRRNATGDERVGIERQLDMLRSITEAASRQRRLTTDLFATLGGLGFGATFEPTGTRLELAASPAPGSLPDRLLGGAARPLKLANAVTARPLLLLEVGAEPRALLELFELWLGSRGADRASIDAAVAQATGRDLRRDLYDNLTGTLGVAITADGPLSLDPAVLRERLDVLASVGVAHRDRATALVGAVAPGDGATLAWPGFKPLHLAATGDALVAATDAAAIERLERARATTEASAMMVLDGWLAAILVSSDPVVPRRLEPTATTPEERAVADRLAQAQDQLAAAIETHARRALERRLEIGAGIGTASLIVRRADGLVRARGRLTGSPRADLAALVTRLEHHRADGRREHDAEAALRSTIERLADQLQTTAPNLQP
jgi:hypothetical protein